MTGGDRDKSAAKGPAIKASRRGATRDRLIAAGEAMIGQRGIDGVSLEEIARAAGQANKYAVQYHFGSREGLIQAILDTRIAAIEVERHALLASMDPTDVHAIIGAFVRPLAHQVDAEGQCAFARFLLQFATQFQPWPDIVHPLSEASGDAASLALFEALCAALPQHAPRLLGERLMLLMHLPLRALLPGPDKQQADPAERLDDVIAMMVAALTAPSR
ncbi:transcriptional regulator, TetR family [Sphingomonas laterariae]|uniref:Transcriptional regulator, TetR family n=1 Tax=Edaphosphingomonas laterariae TaxID=861865 RepID=A0A239G9P1_9SPHN|nr:TetR/AcrR family transcriptional regulator [Sphingomonas laterariae]SNS65508.1 transcriptional regulator, TetR family [Sphingomonas laterariae]